MLGRNKKISVVKLSSTLNRLGSDLDRTDEEKSCIEYIMKIFEIDLERRKSSDNKRIKNGLTWFYKVEEPWHSFIIQYDKKCKEEYRNRIKNRSKSK